MRQKYSKISQKGFTLIELMVALTIFAFMTAFLLAKYGTFNQGTLLTNLAYDVALTIRSAQLYGLDTKSAPGTQNNFSNNFYLPYGVHFDKTTGNNGTILFFVDTNSDGIYNAGDTIESTYTIKRNSFVSGICVGTPCTGVATADVSFKRPDPDALITAGGSASPSYSYLQITLSSNDGGTQNVLVRSNGQISVTN